MSFLQRTDFMQSCITLSLKNKDNYSEPLRRRKADASCLHVSSRFSSSQGGSNRATPTHMSKISCVAARKHEYRAILRMFVGVLNMRGAEWLHKI